MTARFIDDYDVILLDMGKTFMFGCDRFDDAREVDRLYRAAGGMDLAGGLAALVIDQMLQRGLALARDGRHDDTYPTTIAMLRSLPIAARLDEAELDRLVKVFALLEVGAVPATHVAALRALRRTHRLGVVSNVWSPSDRFRDAFRRAGIAELFDVTVFSSDIGAIKPSPAIFERALRGWPIPRERIVYVGDNFKRDVVGAHGVGIDAVWISPGAPAPVDVDDRPEMIIRDLRELSEAMRVAS